MAAPTDYTTGTVTLTSGSANFTTSGSALQSVNIRAGDAIIRNGFFLVIATITGENAGTLVENCPAGAAGAGVALRIRMQNDGSRLTASVAALREALANGNIASIAGLTTSADEVPYYTGSGTATLASLTAFGRSLIDDADAGAAQTTLGFSTYFKTLLGAASAAVLQPLIGAREKLTANRTYYVRTNGSDTNNGLADTAGGAFLTLQKAIDVAAALDTGAFNVTIQVADGTYTGTVTVNGAWTGFGTVTVQGNAGTPANVVVSITGGTAFSVVNGGRLTVKDMKIQTTGGVTYCLYANAGGRINFSNINFGTAGNSHIRASDGGLAVCDGNYSISGNALYHLRSVASGVIRSPSRTVTLTGTPAFTAFAAATDGGNMVVNGNTFSGAATGSRYEASLNGVIDTVGGGPTYFPGNASGTTATGGQYA